uniref:Ig-like domain-containing protein n=1 Tax=Seriola dumerili TaxID=41447 RepID=A0A3B4U167_SERDU
MWCVIYCPIRLIINMILFLIMGDKPKAILLPGTTTIPAGGSVTLTCSVDGSAEWKYYWSRQTSGSYEDLTMRYGDQNREVNISQGGNYWCTGGRGNPVVYTHAISNKVTLTLQPSWRQIFSGETITLRCEIEGGGDIEWEYEWRTPVSSTPWTYVNYRSINASLSCSGSYTCRGAHRGDRDSSTEWSKGITITVSRKSYICYAFISWRVNIQKVQTGVVSILQIYSGEMVTLRCDIKSGGDTEWEYEWVTPTPIHLTEKEFRISFASPRYSGSYRCKGRVKSAQQHSTEWSPWVTLKFSYSESSSFTLLMILCFHYEKSLSTRCTPACPHWVSIMKCEVEHPSAGWRFYWYKTVPDGSQHSYNYELLPGSSSGTRRDSYIVHGQTHTAGYSCRAGRGDPVFYTMYSETKFVWSGGEFVFSFLSLKKQMFCHRVSLFSCLTVIKLY